MKKFVLALAALSAVSTGALAAKGDRADWMDYNQMIKQEMTSTQTLAIKSGETDADKYLNKRQLR